MVSNFLLTLQVLVSFGATWDLKCDDIVVANDSALRTCVLLWTQEHVDGFPLTVIPIEVIERGVDNVQTYIDCLKASREVNFRLQICVVGNTGAGKTSFIKSIISKEPQLSHPDDRTIGIDQYPLSFTATHMREDDYTSKIYQVTFSDYHGKNPSHVIQTAFFSPRTLFFVVIDYEAFTKIYIADKTNNTKALDAFLEREAFSWVHMIVARVPHVELVFIATKDDVVCDPSVTKDQIKQELTTKLQSFDVFRSQGHQTQSPANTTPEIREPTIAFVDATSIASIEAGRTHVQQVVMASNWPMQMPSTYRQVLSDMVQMRENAKGSNSATMVKRIFAPINNLPHQLQIDPILCRIILQTLHDRGDVLWYEDLDVGVFRDTIILDPLVLINFFRPVLDHEPTGLILSHADLIMRPFWKDLDDPKILEGMKKVMQAFHLVYPANKDRVMKWDSHLIVPAYWQTKLPASQRFVDDRLCTEATVNVRVCWEYHFEVGLRVTLFDSIVVACVSPSIRFDAGPDWILTKEKKDLLPVVS